MNHQEKINTIRILLVDDSPYFIEAARDFLGLQPAFDVVSMASNPKEALAQAQRLQPDVILLDLNLAQSSGLALIPVFKQEVARARIIVLTMMEDPSYRTAALKAGADDFVSKRNMSKELARTIFAVAGRAANAPADEQNPLQAAPGQKVSLERLAEHLPDVFYRYELAPKRGFTYVSPAAAAMTGYSLAEYYADPDLGFKLIHSDDRPILEKAAQGNISPQDPVELRCVRKDGTILWFEQRNVPIYDTEGNLIAVEGIARDITERKRAEERLAESEKRHRLISSVAADYMFSTSLRDGKLVLNWVAGAFEAITGYTMDEYVARGGWRAHLHPDDIAQDDRDLENLRAGKRVVTEIRTMTKGGEFRWVRVYAHPILDEHDKNLIGIYGAGQDITERKRAEEAVKASENRNRIIAEMISDYVYIFRVTSEGKLIGEWVTESFTKTFGYTLDEVDARGGWPSLVYPDDLEIALAHAQKVASGETDICEMRWVTARGDIRWLRDYAKPVFDETGKRVVRIYGASQDITERKRAEEESQRQLAELIALHAVAVAVNQSQSVDELIARVTQIVGASFYGEHFGVLLFDEKKKTLRPHASYRGIQNGKYPHAIALNQGISGRVAATRQPQRVGDVRRDRDYIEVTDGTLSELCVPIQSGERLIGVINVESRRLNHFTAADERLLVTIAGQLGSAIEKLRLAQVEQRRLLELEALYENSMAISGLLDADAIARAFMDTLEGRLCWHHAAVRLIEPGGAMRVIGLKSPHFKPGDTVPQKFRLQALVSRVGEGMAGWAAQHGQSLRSGDLPSDPRYVETYAGMHSGLYAPLKVGDETIGVVSVESEQPDAFTELDERLFNTLVAQTALALQRSRIFAAAQRRLRRTQTLRQIDISIASHAPLEETIRHVLRHATAELGVDAAIVLLLDPRDQRLKYKFGMGFHTDALQSTSLALGEGYAGRAALTRRPIVISNLQARTTDFLRSPTFAQEKFVSYFGVPLIVEHQVLGVMELFHRALLQPDEEWLDFMETLAGQIAIAIDNATLYENLQQANLQLTAAYDATIEGWSRALDLRDKETEGHTQRVTELTLKLARQMGISEADLIHIRRGALLHDIGKMGVPDSILLKPGPLSEEEWRIMHRHPQYAYEMLAPIEYLRPALDIPHYHHERWDGTGYPHKLKGEQIPLAARIFALVDVWDALTSDRPYRKAWSPRKALAHIYKQSGKHFDPQVVEAFKALIGHEGQP